MASPTCDEATALDSVWLIGDKPCWQDAWSYNTICYAGQAFPKTAYF